MRKLNSEVQDLMRKFKDAAFPLTPKQKEKLRLERERIYTLNEKIYGRTRMLKEASLKELKEYEKNKMLIKDLRDIEVEAGASW